MSYYRLLPLEVDILRGAEVTRDRQTVKVRADLAVVNGDDVEEEHQTDEDRGGGEETHIDQGYLLLPVVAPEGDERQ